METRRLETARPEDAEAVFALYQKVIRAGNTTWNEYYPSMEEVETDLKENGLYVLREDGKIIAAVSLVKHDDLDDEPLDWTDGESCALARLCVDPEMRNQGIGEWMVRSAMRQAAVQGNEWMRLLVVNRTAERIYQRIGFRQTGETELYGHRYRAYECRIQTGKVQKK